MKLQKHFNSQPQKEGVRTMKIIKSITILSMMFFLVSLEMPYAEAKSCKDPRPEQPKKPPC